MKQVITGIVLGIGLSFAGGAFAHQVERLSHWSYQQEFKSGLIPPMLKIKQSLHHLNLTTDQREEIQVLLENASALLRGLPNEYSQHIERLNELIRSEQFDGTTYREILAQMHQKKADYAVVIARVKNQVWNLLTEQQRERW